MSQFKVGDVCYYFNFGNRSRLFTIEFFGTGEDSAILYPVNSDQRATESFVVVWDNGKSWMPSNEIKKLSKLEQVMK